MINKKDITSYRYVSREEMRELDRLAIVRHEIPGIILMENAGAGAAQIILEYIDSNGVVIFCGPGNNGGDGFVVARHLHNAGIPVQVFFVGDISKISKDSDPGINLNILEKMDIFPLEIENVEQLKEHYLHKSHPEWIVDAIFGSGLSGPVRGPFDRVIEEIASWNKTVFAIDLPSGLDADTGEILGVSLQASYTLTFALPKKGLSLKQGPKMAGQVFVVNISIPRHLLD